MWKLYDLPRNTVFTLNGQSFLLHNIDGMYSYCTLLDDSGTDTGEVFHFAAWTEVELS